MGTKFEVSNTGQLDMKTNKIVNLAAPFGDNDAARKVDAAAGSPQTIKDLHGDGVYSGFGLSSLYVAPTWSSYVAPNAAWKIETANQKGDSPTYIETNGTSAPVSGDITITPGTTSNFGKVMLKWTGVGTSTTRLDWSTYSLGNNVGTGNDGCRAYLWSFLQSKWIPYTDHGSTSLSQINSTSFAHVVVAAAYANDWISDTGVVYILITSRSSKEAASALTVTVRPNDISYCYIRTATDAFNTSDQVAAGVNYRGGVRETKTQTDLSFTWNNRWSYYSTVKIDNTGAVVKASPSLTETVWDYNTGTHKAYKINSTATIPYNYTPTTYIAAATLFTSGEYDNIKSENDVGATTTATTNTYYASQLYKFELGAGAITDINIFMLNIRFYSRRKTFGALSESNQIVNIWNFTTSAWEGFMSYDNNDSTFWDRESQRNPSDTPSKYIDGSGYMYFLVYHEVASDGTNNPTVSVDYIKLAKNDTRAPTTASDETKLGEQEFNRWYPWLQWGLPLTTGRQFISYGNVRVKEFTSATEYTTTTVGPSTLATTFNLAPLSPNNILLGAWAEADMHGSTGQTVRFRLWIRGQDPELAGIDIPTNETSGCIGETGSTSYTTVPSDTSAVKRCIIGINRDWNPSSDMWQALRGAQFGDGNYNIEVRFWNATAGTAYIKNIKVKIYYLDLGMVV